MTITGDAQSDREALDRAVRTVLALLPQDQAVTAAEIADNVNFIHGRFGVDRNELLRAVQSLVSVWQDVPTGLEDLRGHVEWLIDVKNERRWDFWDRYRRYLEDVRMLPPLVVTRTHTSTDRILGLLEDPQRQGQWRRTGLVVGQVQSGKTGNYIALACKAADAGYKLIVVLAGSWNNLRSQTQLRIDEGLLGFDTQYQTRYDEERASSRIGVGEMPGAVRLKVASLTTSAERGDFRRTIAANMALPIGDYPVVLVVKKNRSILNNLRKWIVEVQGEPVGTDGEKIVRDVPLLVIDDEADNASINTRDANTEPSAVNRAIRDLMNSFDRRAYVGYTATPFANIYIKPSDGSDRFGFDIFPDSFIENLTAPSNYFGPERVFGLRTEDPDEDDIEALPVFRTVNDHTTWMPDIHRKDWIPPDSLPLSLRTAVESFILTCAARRARNQVNAHNSMLIHVTRFQQVQNRVKEQVEDLVRLLHDSIRDIYGSSSGTVIARLRQLWEQDYVPTMSQFPADGLRPASWEQVREELRPALAKIVVRAVNGSSADALEYYENRRTGLSVIAVGGDKLSRGLTLEGLSVSYYLRSSKAYDTLLQMGRWFGYRPGYEDLCRLNTTRALGAAYAEITAADDELRRDFEEMSVLRATPSDFGLRVRASPASLIVTAPNKMRHGVKVKLSYSGDLAETVTFDLRDGALRENSDNLTRFLSRLDHLAAPETKDNGTVWKGVGPEEIVDSFLAGYVPDGKAQRVRPAFLAEYIRNCRRFNELSNWTVRLVSKTGGAPRRIGDHQVSFITRRATNTPSAADPRYTIRRILSPADETFDLGPEQYDLALARTKEIAKGKINRTTGKPRDPQIPTGPPLRGVRRANQPLLLLYPLRHPLETDGLERSPVAGFAISFPRSAHATETEYVVNDIWRQQQFDGDDEDPDE